MENDQPTNRNSENNLVTFTEAQKAMLKMSEEDIRQGRIITQEQLDEEDMRWLHGQSHRSPK